MATAQVNGVQLYYEESGQGHALVFSHEFAGDYRSWEPQVRYFSRFYRVITYNHRGYPPSSVPEQADQYAEELLVEDLYALLRHLRIEQAHVVGLSMGGFVALQLGMRHPEICRSLVIAGVGTGADNHESFLNEVRATADALERQPEETFASYARGPSRVPFMRKDPRGWREFAALLGQHSPAGSARVLRGVQGGRRTLYEREADLRTMTVPALVVTGDEDEPCLDPSAFMKRRLANAGLLVVPKSGHTINLEEPEQFNRAVLEFLVAVEHGRWFTREEVTTSLLPAEARG